MDVDTEVDILGEATDIFWQLLKRCVCQSWEIAMGGIDPLIQGISTVNHLGNFVHTYKIYIQTIIEVNCISNSRVHNTYRHGLPYCQKTPIYFLTLWSRHNDRFQSCNRWQTVVQGWLLCQNQLQFSQKYNIIIYKYGNGNTGLKFSNLHRGFSQNHHAHLTLVYTITSFKHKLKQYYDKL